MKNYKWSDLTVTNQKLPNIPNATQKTNIEYLVNKILDPLQDRLNLKIKINSCFRSSAVNKAVGGVASSQHCANNGAAADITCSNNYLLFKTIECGFPFDQLIWEYGNDSAPQWVHVSLKKSGNRQQILRKKSGDSQYKEYDD